MAANNSKAREIKPTRTVSSFEKRKAALGSIRGSLRDEHYSKLRSATHQLGKETENMQHFKTDSEFFKALEDLWADKSKSASVALLLCSYLQYKSLLESEDVDCSFFLNPQIWDKILTLNRDSKDIETQLYVYQFLCNLTHAEGFGQKKVSLHCIASNLHARTLDLLIQTEGVEVGQTRLDEWREKMVCFIGNILYDCREQCRDFITAGGLNMVLRYIENPRERLWTLPTGLNLLTALLSNESTWIITLEEQFKKLRSVIQDLYGFCLDSFIIGTSSSSEITNLHSTLTLAIYEYYLSQSKDVEEGAFSLTTSFHPAYWRANLIDLAVVFDDFLTLRFPQSELLELRILLLFTTSKTKITNELVKMGCLKHCLSLLFIRPRDERIYGDYGACLYDCITNLLDTDIAALNFFRADLQFHPMESGDPLELFLCDVTEPGNFGLSAAFLLITAARLSEDVLFDALVKRGAFEILVECIPNIESHMDEVQNSLIEAILKSILFAHQREDRRRTLVPFDENFLPSPRVIYRLLKTDLQEILSSIFNDKHTPPLLSETSSKLLDILDVYEKKKELEEEYSGDYDDDLYHDVQVPPDDFSMDLESAPTVYNF